MTLTLIGVNHRTAPVEVREQLSVGESSLAEVLASIRGIDGVRGAAVTSTCNRVETVVSSNDDCVLDPLVGFMASRTSLSRDEVEKHLYVLRHRDVVRHLFRVASGLDSMIVGEPQIGGQVRKAFQTAQDHAALDPVLSKLFEQTLHVSKKVRTETGIGEHAVSIPFAGVELARKIFGELDGLRALLVGAGKIGELTAVHLHGFGLDKVLVANRAFEKARELAARFDGEAIEFSSLGTTLATCDIVIVSTAAPHYTVTACDVELALAERPRRPLFLIDLSVPRNIDPDVAGVDGAYLYNIDDLKEVADTNREKRAKKAEVAEQIIEREVDAFIRRLASHEVVPTIVELQSRLEQIRRAELEKCLRRLGPITTEQHAAVEMLTTGIINKVLHYPIIRLKESAADAQPAGGETMKETIRRIFGLR
jgi:glutamyl-tRNA reductase